MRLRSSIMVGQLALLLAASIAWRRGIGLLIAGQHVRRILGLATRAYLLDQGRITAHAPAGELLHSTHLRQALLGAG